MADSLSLFAGKERDSTSLVPGDIVNLNNPPLTTFPSDIFLLSGDAIVNESMLTGESIPVSKIPIKDDGLAKWKDQKDISGDTAKSLLYAGTRVVRIRSAVMTDGSVGTPAIGLVVRTGRFEFTLEGSLVNLPSGFNTTKGALVRSMLFPKPMGFKFYRDSIRFILVLAGLAGLGFCASAVQFIRLGVTILHSPFSRRLTFRNPGTMAYHPYPCIGLDHGSGSTCPPCNTLHRYQFLDWSTSQTWDFLHLTKPCQRRRKDQCMLFRQNWYPYRGWVRHPRDSES